ncbi:phosphopantetheine-binding protein [uncultured Thiocystis sp.]|jgi:acyl carrier protein|uniref:phosphopantetheine-binding protein n=1 Tax=uncultured Thiocystis sp. TaxID=1202134 RepID=UPI0025ED43B4|nr:phosphopantetheine-binding protein [uncultured Thiocystis sp.]
MAEQPIASRPAIEEVERLVIQALRLEDVGITKIDPDEALFGDGLGLDSIDALELALAVTREYGVTISSDHPEIQRIFSSLTHLTAYIQDRRTD